MCKPPIDQTKSAGCFTEQRGAGVFGKKHCDNIPTPLPTSRQDSWQSLDAASNRALGWTYVAMKACEEERGEKSQ